MGTVLLVTKFVTKRTVPMAFGMSFVFMEKSSCLLEIAELVVKFLSHAAHPGRLVLGVGNIVGNVVDIGCNFLRRRRVLFGDGGQVGYIVMDRFLHLVQGLRLG